jgi:diguanylate cyclase (GGDEF)-like protein
LDLDNFADVNAAYLLTGGDKALAEVARLVSALAGPDNPVFRDGGDQFTVVMFGADIDEAWKAAERIRRGIAAARFELGGFEPITLTVSVGVAMLTPDVTNVSELFDRARDAVHRAKAAGRNRVER